MSEKETAKWYVVHTYSGYENKVKANLEKIIENRNLQDKILQIVVPTEKVTEIKDGKKKVVERKIFPGYVLVKMIMTDETWYVVRNTRGVTGFVGPGSKPVPLTDAEVRALGIKDVSTAVDLNVKDTVRVVSGPFENFIGVVQEVYPERQKAKVLISMFGRETPVEFDLVQLQKI
ncbi:MAG: Transcription termination/antitermination protein nusG [Caldanaerobacter subterraneus]|jgi:transcriptional antiterminator NusG|uniref:Transcription termination/antitermination protein NusG n=3 Tax=Caldanaerobacter subterraneus TaxID=911092 RepID=Q8R7U1_CALS4|nr:MULTISPECIES: transcription termination/antitermination protein NusG [Caldanaerobacter]AAM25448.1 Transcription antiterminator [Caldanaerobacter subterraneus subsp. tengcongensis MB4]ERM90969.1 antitermination factor NusG [Caldanaerobacter subterraneus subsp. yonseiensis KB-1]KUK08068.1 MAG: Transcription termination/antitermination protein nusG [Caldanaerobacter subterraneus]MBE3579974.1 transcription termination/antitermination protein NusG [Caldanaerobacter subterraneus]MCS3914947.1 tran